jgi:hypothetical protein
LWQKFYFFLKMVSCTYWSRTFFKRDLTVRCTTC